MAEEIKISELPAADQANVDDLLEASQVEGSGWVTKQISLDQVSTLVAASDQITGVIDAAIGELPPPAADWGSITGKPSTFPPDPEAVDDRVAGLLVAGSNISLAYNDAANSLTVNATAAPVSIPVGSVAYGGAGGAVTGVLADFAWDTTNKRLGIGVAAPAYKFHIAIPTGDIFTIDNSGIVSSSGGINAVSAAALLAGGDWWFGYHLGTGSGGYLGLFGGTGAPTLSTFGKFGSIYLNASTPGLPYYNNNGTTGWDRLVGETSTQTLTNKSLTSPTITGTPSIAGYLPLGGGALTGPLTGTTATFSGTVSAPGAQIQMVSTQTGAWTTGTTVIPQDDTVPQITEGDQYMTLAITPKSATSKLIIDVTWVGSSSVLNNVVVALFQDSTANALACAVELLAATSLNTINFTHTMTSGTTSATTFRVRAGGNAAGTTGFNGLNAGRLYGGVVASSIVIREVV